MNSIPEALNLWGERFVGLAWPMLWQSSLLACVLWLVDRLLRRKVRPAIRYALWLVLLVKLVVPPSFASPSSLAWWLRRNAPAAPPRASTVRIIYSDKPVEAPARLSRIESVPRPARLSLSAIVLAGAGSVSAALLACLLLRWRQITRMVSQAAPPSAEISRLLEQTCRQAGYARTPVVRVAGKPMSPAVCGLLRPVILLPQSLVNELSTDQLRAVLLHEIAHVRRADVWVNCAQGLLQLVYWWHPLLWLANARIRRLREEAVDDAVILALRGDSGIYAPTLLAVARLALNRSLAGLGLVGILESRNALRQRVERLLSVTTPRRAGLSVVSISGILAFGAMAVPMGPAPSRPAPWGPAGIEHVSVFPPDQSVRLTLGSLRPLEVSSGTASYDVDTRTFNASNGVVLRGTNYTLTADSIRIDQSAGSLVARGDPNLTLDPSNAPMSAKGISSDRWGASSGTSSSQAGAVAPVVISLHRDGSYWLGGSPIAAQPLQVRLAQASKANTRLEVRLRVDENARMEDILPLVKLCREAGVARISLRTSPAPSAETPVAFLNASAGRQNIIRKLQQIRLNKVAFNGEPLRDVVRKLGEMVKESDPEHKGINFLISPDRQPTVTAQPANGSTPAGAIDPTTGLPKAVSGRQIDPTTGLPLASAANEAEPVDSGSAVITIDPPLTDIRLADVLDAIVKTASGPIQYSILDYGIRFSLRDLKSLELKTRTFKVDP
jgi:beta-lactamase regulating signal transducer with metallopeptidase domain/biopolymer transport protein ExbD